MEMCAGGLDRKLGWRPGLDVGSMLELELGSALSLSDQPCLEGQILCGYLMPLSRCLWPWVTWRERLRLPSQGEVAVFACSLFRGAAQAPTPLGTQRRKGVQPASSGPGPTRAQVLPSDSSPGVTARGGRAGGWHPGPGERRAHLSIWAPGSCLEPKTPADCTGPGPPAAIPMATVTPMGDSACLRRVMPALRITRMTLVPGVLRCAQPGTLRRLLRACRPGGQRSPRTGLQVGAGPLPRPSSHLSPLPSLSPSVSLTLRMVGGLSPPPPSAPLQSGQAVGQVDERQASGGWRLPAPPCPGTVT